MIEVVLVALLATHLLAVDVAMAGPLVSVWMEWRATRSNEPLAARVALGMARLSLAMLLVGIALGALLLTIRWWLDDHAYFSALALIPRSRLWFALAELAFFILCMTAYLSLWNRWSGHRYLHRALAVAAALNLLVHFPALFAIVSVASTRRQLWGQVLDRAGYWRLLLDGEVASRIVHVWLAALVIAGIVLMFLALRNADTEQPAATASIVQRGAWLSLAAALLQIPVGLWTTIELPEAVQTRLLGDNLLATGLFLGSLLLALYLMHALANLALGDPQRKQVVRCFATACALVLAMTGTRACLQHVAPTGSAGRFTTPTPAPLATSAGLPHVISTLPWELKAHRPPSN